MSKDISVCLTEEEVELMFDAMDSEARHWDLCGGTDEDNRRYSAAAQSYKAIAGKLQAALEHAETNK